MKHLLVLLLGLPLLASAAGNDWTFGALSTRSPRTALDNPAQLAWPVDAPLGIELPGGSAAVSNNSFGIKFWNSHIAGDAYWDAAETRQILDRIPASGLGLHGDISIPGLGVRYRTFAFNVQALAAADVNVPKEIAEVALVGNTLGQTYSLSDFAGTSIAITDFSAAWAYRVAQPWIPEIAAGIGLHYYRGVVMAASTQSGGYFVATDDLLQGSGDFSNVLAENGAGFGVDLGLSATVLPKLRAGLAVQHLGARLNWDVRETQITHFETSAAGLDIDSLDEESYTDRVFESSDTTLKGGSTTSRLPLTLRLSAEYRVNPAWSVAGLLNVRTQASAFGKAGSEAGVATGYYPLRWVVVQGGVLLGGPHRSLFTAGTGLRFRHFELDVGCSAAGGLFGGARGAGLNVAQRIFF